MGKILKVIDAINLKICYVAMVALFFLMCMTTVHALLRKLTSGSGIRDSLGITELVMVLIVFCGFAFMQSERGHVKVDALTQKFSKPLAKIVGFLMLLITSGILFVLFYAVVANIAPTMNKGAATQVLHIPHWPFMIVIAIGLLSYAITVLAHAVECIVKPVKSLEIQKEAEVDVTTQM